MLTIKEVIQLALSKYGRRSFMCHTVEKLNIDSEEITKTLDFIKSQLHGNFTLNSFLAKNSNEYETICDSHPAGYESDEPYAYRVKWWNKLIKLPEAQV